MVYKTRQAREKHWEKLTQAMKNKKRQWYRDTADQVFSKFIRNRDKKCFTCWGKNDHNGHFISRRIYQYRWDEINNNSQCYRCNVWLNWNYIIYTKRMIEKYWKDFVDEMIANSYKVGKKPSINDLYEIIIKYKKRLTPVQKKTILLSYNKV